MKIKRLVKAGEANLNGYTYEKQSTDKALDDYIKSGKGYIYKPLELSESGFVKTDLYKINSEEIIGLCDKYDDEYIYVSELFDEDYKDQLDNYTCQICIEIKDEKHLESYREIKLCITEKVLQLRLVKK